MYSGDKIFLVTFVDIDADGLKGPGMDNEASDTSAEGITGRANPVLAGFRAAEARSSRPGEGVTGERVRSPASTACVLATPLPAESINLDQLLTQLQKLKTIH